MVLLRQCICHYRNRIELSQCIITTKFTIATTHLLKYKYTNTTTLMITLKNLLPSFCWIMCNNIYPIKCTESIILHQEYKNINVFGCSNVHAHFFSLCVRCTSIFVMVFICDHNVVMFMHPSTHHIQGKYTKWHIWHY